MRQWILIGLVALLAGCSSTRSNRQHAGNGEGAIESSRLASLETEMAGVAESRAWSNQYLLGARMVNAWVDGDDLFVEAFNPETRMFELHAIDVRSGRPRWKLDIGDIALRMAPGAGRSFVVLLESDGGMVVVKRSNGARVHRMRATISMVPTAPPASTASTIYIGSLADSRIYAISPADAARGWHWRAADSISSGPMVPGHTPAGLVVSAAEGGLITALPAVAWDDVPPERPSWTYRALGSVTIPFATGTVKQGERTVGVTLAAAEDKAIHCLETSTGSPIWVHRTSAPFRGSLTGEESSRPALQVMGGRVFCPNRDGMVVATLEDGMAAWKGETPDGGSPAWRRALRAYAGNGRRVYLDMGNKMVIKCDMTNGSVLGQGFLTSFDKVVPTADGDLLLGLTEDGYIVAYR